MDGYWVEVDSPLDSAGARRTTSRQFRIFRNGRGLRFAGRIHEQLQRAGGAAPLMTGQNQVSVRHHGYVLEPAEKQAKAERNARLLARSIEEDPDSPHLHFFLAQQHAWLGHYDAALQAAERAMELWKEAGSPPGEYVHQLFTTGAACAAELHRYEQAIAFEATLPAEDTAAEMLCVLGQAYAALGQPQEAIERLERACRDETIHRDGDPSASGWRPLLGLAELYAGLDRMHDCYQALRQAHQAAPTRPDTLLLLGFTSARLKNASEAATWFRQVVEGDFHDRYHEKARRAMLDLANSAGNTELALEALSGQVEGLDPARTALVTARVLASAGDVGRQHEVLVRAHEQFPGDVRVAMALADALIQQQRYGESAVMLDRAQKALGTA
jgi:tetratricopeptide (TPR) repeat protein